MNDPFFEYFKQERKTVSQNIYGPEEPRFKEYDRVKKILLPPAEHIPKPLDSLLETRHSLREYGEPLARAQISSLLYWSVGNIEHNSIYRRPFPSGGAKYPTEAYLIVFDMKDIEPGAYHYNAKKHELEVLSIGDYRSVLTDVHQYSYVAWASAVLCLTFVKSRSIQKYGGLAYKLGLLEAGHVGQNVYLVSNALGFGCCGLGGGDKEEVYDILGIDGGNEHIIYNLALGNPEEDT